MLFLNCNFENEQTLIGLTVNRVHVVALFYNEDCIFKNRQ